MTVRDEVTPRQDDPLVAASVEVLGGPLGRHAGPRRGGLTPLRILMALVIVASFFSVTAKQHCRTHGWDVTDASIHQCYSDIGVLYSARGLDQGAVPYYGPADRPEQWVEYPVLTGEVMYLTALIARDRGDDLAQRRLYFDINALLFAICALATTVGVAYLARRRRVWDAAMVAVAPAAILAGTINWDWWAVAVSTLALLAWSRRRPVLAGVLLGLAVALKFYPLVFLGPLALLAWRRRTLPPFVGTTLAAVGTWLVVNLPVMLTSWEQWSLFYRFSSDRPVSFGSLWYSLQPYGIELGPSAANRWMELTLLVGFGAVAVIALRAPRPPRLASLLFLAVTVFVLANKVYSPQYVLWLIPLAVLARPRWRDFLVWQATELVHFAAVWMYLSGPDHRGISQESYSLASFLHMAGLLYLCFFVVRDIYRPELDPVRSDGTDDPAGGPFDGAPDTTAAGRLLEPVGAGAGGSR